jgi:hypothetical protein
MAKKIQDERTEQMAEWADYLFKVAELDRFIANMKDARNREQAYAYQNRTGVFTTKK